MIKHQTQTILFVRESYGLKETGMLTYTYPRFDKSGGTAKVPDDHLMPLGYPNMWTSFKVRTRGPVELIIQHFLGGGQTNWSASHWARPTG